MLGSIKPKVDEGVNMTLIGDVVSGIGTWIKARDRQNALANDERDRIASAVEQMSDCLAQLAEETENGLRGTYRQFDEFATYCENFQNLTSHTLEENTLSAISKILEWAYAVDMGETHSDKLQHEIGLDNLDELAMIALRASGRLKAHAVLIRAGL